MRSLRPSNWPLRIAELYQGLADKDANLHAAMLRHHFSRRVGATPHTYRSTFRART